MPEERIDVITPDGIFTGVTKKKSQVHADGDWHAVALGVITDGQGRVVIQFRGPKVKKWRNMWDIMSVSEHISAYEGHPDGRYLLVQASDALICGFEEELGIKITPDIFLGVDGQFVGITRTNQRTDDGWTDRTLNVVFVLMMPDLDLTTCKLQRGKVSQVKWSYIEEIEQAMAQGRRFAERQPDNALLLAMVFEAVRSMAAREH